METQGNKFKRLVEIFFYLTEAQDVNELLQILLDGALDLVEAGHGSIYRLNYQTGEIEIVHHKPNNRPKIQNNQWGEGVLGMALKDYKIVNVDDTLSDQWKDIYIPDWKDMRSEIAVPIFRDNMPVRLGNKVKKTGRKRIGVLSIESEKANTFSEEDEILLFDLARYAAIRIEDIESDLKLKDLRKKEQEIADSSRAYNQIIELVTDGIVNILKFDIVNISLVNSKIGIIESRHVCGIPESRKAEFMARASHKLGSDDIQADIIRTKKIEVPEQNDPRFDKKLAKDFDHEKLVRVFIPMIEAASDIANGTIECGYQREYREFIYERDIQILENFVNHASQALNRKEFATIEMIAHEFRHHISGIRNHADLLLNWGKRFREDEIYAKYDDMLTDCSILYYQVDSLEIKMGSNISRELKREKVSIANEITKIVKQVKPMLRAREFAGNGIEYQFSDPVKQLRVDTDRALFNQILYNLLINSIKYAEEDPEKFSVRIIVIPMAGKVLVKFRDKGIGVDDNEKDEIFKPGFRGRNVSIKESGSGMGLSISKDLITRLGGELLLSSTRNPTEFHIIMPMLKQ